MSAIVNIDTPPAQRNEPKPVLTEQQNKEIIEAFTGRMPEELKRRLTNIDLDSLKKISEAYLRWYFINPKDKKNSRWEILNVIGQQARLKSPLDASREAQIKIRAEMAKENINSNSYNALLLGSALNQANPDFFQWRIEDIPSVTEICMVEQRLSILGVQFKKTSIGMLQILIQGIFMALSGYQTYDGFSEIETSDKQTATINVALITLAAIATSLQKYLNDSIISDRLLPKIRKQLKDNIKKTAEPYQYRQLASTPDADVSYNSESSCFPCKKIQIFPDKNEELDIKKLLRDMLIKKKFPNAVQAIVSLVVQNPGGDIAKQTKYWIISCIHSRNTKNILPAAILADRINQRLITQNEDEEIKKVIWFPWCSADLAKVEEADQLHKQISTNCGSIYMSSLRNTLVFLNVLNTMSTLLSTIIDVYNPSSTFRTPRAIGNICLVVIIFIIQNLLNTKFVANSLMTNMLNDYLSSPKKIDIENGIPKSEPEPEPEPEHTTIQTI
eukprot:COSAG01_NODE_2372_length_7810_cov_5.360135_4_plen_501_part_00